MKKIVGAMCIAMGCAFIAFIFFTSVRSQNELVSPIPNMQGIKVIQISPTK